MWILLAAAASAAPQVAVLGLHIDGMSLEQQRQTAADIVQTLTATGAMEGVGPDQVATRLKGRESLVLESFALSQGRDMLDQGRVLYQNAEPDAAIPLLQAAVASLTQGSESTGSTTDLIEGYLTLGMVQAAMGNTEAAGEAFSAVVVLDPTRALDTMSYPPDVIELYTATQAQVLEAGTGTLLVDAPKDSLVLVDGQAVEPGPVTGLAPGMHYVWVEAPSGERFYTSTGVEPSSSTKISASFDGLHLSHGHGDLNLQMAETERLYQALGTYAQTPLVLLGGQVGDQIVVALYSANSKNFSQSLSAPAGEDPVQSLMNLLPAMGSYLSASGEIRPDRVAFDVPALNVNQNALLSQLLLAPSEPAVLAPGQATTSPRWGLWAGVGGVAALGAGAATWALMRDPEPAEQGTIVFGPIP